MATAKEYELSGGESNSSSYETIVAAGNDKVLNLSIRSLTRLPNSLLQLNSLEILYLDYNGLMQLPDDFFVLLPRLQWLDVSSNFLSELPSKGLTSQCKLRGLLVANNRIECLPTQIVLLKSLSIFTCYGNPLIFPPKDISPINTLEIFDYLRCFEPLKRGSRPSRKQAKQRQRRQSRKFGAKHSLLPPIGVLGRAAPALRRCAREDEMDQPEAEPVEYTATISREYDLEEWFKTMKLNAKDDKIKLMSVMKFLIPRTPDSLEDKPVSRENQIKLTLQKMHDTEKQIWNHVGSKFIRRKEVFVDPEAELTTAMYEAMGYEDLHNKLATLRNELDWIQPSAKDCNDSN